MESAEYQLKKELIYLQEKFESLLSKVKEYENEKKFSDLKMKIHKPFSGHYLKPYEQKEYRRTIYDGKVIWEYFDNELTQWFVVDIESQSERLENIFKNDCLVTPPEENKLHDHNHDHNSNYFHSQF